MRAHLLQIVPHRTSRPDGIGDYAVRLAEHLSVRHGVATTFLAGTPEGEEPPARDPWPTRRVAARSAKALYETLRDMRAPCAVLLHVSGYGYQRRGAPLWLVGGLRRARRAGVLPRMTGLFHELFATGKPWTSAFWLQGLQKHAVRGQWSLCDRAIATTSSYTRQLAAWRPEAAGGVRQLAVPATVGEPDAVVPIGERPPRAVLFGRPGCERDVYGTHAHAFAAALSRLGIAEIIDIGGREGELPSHLGAIPVRPRGVLSHQAIAAELLQCRAGLLSYDVARLAKSSVFAAYAANGVVALCAPSSRRPGDGLVAGSHLVTDLTTATSALDLQAIQDRARQWYAPHAWPRAADIIARDLGLAA